MSTVQSSPNKIGQKNDDIIEEEGELKDDDSHGSKKEDDGIESPPHDMTLKKNDHADQYFEGIDEDE